VGQQISDVAVLGLGGMGSSAAYHLARRGKSVVGLEQFTAAHDRGSSHGQSRVIRQAYSEGPNYVPLIRRAYELWHELEQTSGVELLRLTGGLMIGAEECWIVHGSLISARAHDLPHELLSSAELQRRFPMLRVGSDVALFEERAGAIFPEACILAHLDLAARHGAELRFGTRVEAWRPVDDGVEIVADGRTVRARRLILTAGAWAGPLLAELGLPLQPERNVIFWMQPVTKTAAFGAGRFPVFIWHHPTEPPLYGLPDLHGEGVKVGLHHSGVTVDPDGSRHGTDAADVVAIRRSLDERIPALNGDIRASTVCMYTNTPDDHFVIGLHPAHPQVALAAGFSGHGYKFASVVGEILAGLAIEGSTPYSIEQFAIGRFEAGVARPGPLGLRGPQE